MGAPIAAPRASTREAVLATGAGFLGWTLDAFDFFLVVIALPQIARDYGVEPHKIAFANTLTLAFRPVGAFIFGLLADRYGRRLPMMADLVFYSAVEVATAFAPTYTSFLVLRALFGIGMGGEWGVGASLVMEKTPPRWRGLLSGFLQEGYAAGGLLAAVAGHLMLERCGWRPMFYLGGAPALLALLIRFSVRESEVWEKTKAESWSHLGRSIASHWRLFLFLVALMTMMNLSSHGTQDQYPTFLQDFRGLSTTDKSRVFEIGMTGAIIGGVLVGLLSDRFGRRRMKMVAFAGALVIVPLWAYAQSWGGIIAGAFLMQFMVQGAWGIVPAHINELSPDRVRGFLPGFAYQCGNLMSSWIGWAQASLARHAPYPHVLAISGAAIFAAAIVVVGLGKEKRGVVFGQDGDGA